MSTVEDLEAQVDYIVNRYEDIDKEKEEKRKQRKKMFNNISVYTPFIALVIVTTLLIGLVWGATLFH